MLITYNHINYKSYWGITFVALKNEGGLLYEWGSKTKA